MNRGEALSARRAALLAEADRLRDELARHCAGLAGPAAAVDAARGLWSRLRRVPLKLIVGLARQGLGAALKDETRRATLLAGAASGATALLARLRLRRRKRAPRPTEAAPP